MHPWTYTGSQSCCSGRRPSYKHKPRREQREAQTLQPCQTHPVLFTPSKHPTFTGIFKFPSAIHQVIFRWHRHLPFLLFLERLCTLPSQPGASTAPDAQLQPAAPAGRAALAQHEAAAREQEERCSCISPVTADQRPAGWTPTAEHGERQRTGTASPPAFTLTNRRDSSVHWCLGMK